MLASLNTSLYGFNIREGPFHFDYFLTGLIQPNSIIPAIYHRQIIQTFGFTAKMDGKGTILVWGSDNIMHTVVIVSILLAVTILVVEIKRPKSINQIILNGYFICPTGRFGSICAAVSARTKLSKLTTTDSAATACRLRIQTTHTMIVVVGNFFFTHNTFHPFVLLANICNRDMATAMSSDKRKRLACTGYGPLGLTLIQFPVLCLLNNFRKFPLLCALLGHCYRCPCVFSA